MCSWEVELLILWFGHVSRHFPDPTHLKSKERNGCKESRPLLTEMSCADCLNWRPSLSKHCFQGWGIFQKFIKQLWREAVRPQTWTALEEKGLKTWTLTPHFTEVVSPKQWHWLAPSWAFIAEPLKSGHWFGLSRTSQPMDSIWVWKLSCSDRKHCYLT